MSKVSINESTLTSIGNAIRAKTGKSELIAPLNMPDEISSIQTGGIVESLDIVANGTYTPPEGIDGYNPITVNVPQDGSPPESAFLITGDCEYRFANDGWNWFIEEYGKQITSLDITSCDCMFEDAKALKKIPFDINMSNITHYNSNSIFRSCFNLTEIGTIRGLKPSNIQYLFYNCYGLRHLPVFENLDASVLHKEKYNSASCIFQNCFSLRSIDENLLKELYNINASSYSGYLNNMFNSCRVLDEIRGVNFDSNVSWTSNMFQSTFYFTYRLKDMMFAINEDGTPKAANWKGQTINLTKSVGYVPATSLSDVTTAYNSGITADKEVIDDASYQALKNDADWFTRDIAYSRYNHDSAVNTINSLPDTSAYLAEKGGTNTIQFQGASGSKTDGGAINTLTEAEIAVAAAKGWTVSFA